MEKYKKKLFAIKTENVSSSKTTIHKHNDSSQKSMLFQKVKYFFYWFVGARKTN